MSVGGVGGQRRWASVLPCGRGLTLLAEEVQVGLPLPGLVEDILHLGHEVLHAAGEPCISHVSHAVEDFEFAHAQP